MTKKTFLLNFSVKKKQFPTYGSRWGRDPTKGPRVGRTSGPPHRRVQAFWVLTLLPQPRRPRRRGAGAAGRPGPEGWARNQDPAAR